MQGEELPIGLRCGTGVVSLADIGLARSVLLLVNCFVALEFVGSVLLVSNWLLFICGQSLACRVRS